MCTPIFHRPIISNVLFLLYHYRISLIVIFLNDILIQFDVCVYVCAEKTTCFNHNHNLNSINQDPKSKNRIVEEDNIRGEKIALNDEYAMHLYDLSKWEKLSLKVEHNHLNDRSGSRIDSPERHVCNRLPIMYT